MKLSQQQAAAILTLKEQWQALKTLVEKEDWELHQLLTAQQKAITQTGIELLRKYLVAAENLLPNGIPKKGELIKKQQFIEEVLLQLQDLHQSECLKKIQQRATQQLSKQPLVVLLQQLPATTPFMQLFINKLQNKIPSMKTWEDFKVMLCILIAQYSLQKNLLHHYEQTEHWQYYQQTTAPIQQLQKDFEYLTQTLNTLID